jgi:hypothetical protein
MRRLVVLMAVLATGFILVVPAALAATPTQVYKDYADNGRLDRQYSRSDINRALKDAVLQGYGAPNVQQGLQEQLGQAAGVKSGGGGLPFTGLDLTLMVVGGMTLLIAGAGMRRLARNKA